MGQLNSFDINKLRDSSASSVFFAPMLAALKHSSSRRECSELDDSLWLSLGVSRILHAALSGRAFLQQTAACFSSSPSITLFFEALKSKRRLQLVKDVSRSLAKTMLPDQDPFAAVPALDEFDLYAADGHWHGASTHETQIAGRKWAVGHFYALNMRTRAMTHLTGTLQETKHEHDLHAIKRLGKTVMRQDAPKGRKVIYAYDSAAIDFTMWGDWKASAGIYFVSRAKDNMTKQVICENPIDRNNSQNSGVLFDQGIANTSQRIIRMITYRCPSTGRLFEFVTNEMTVEPGVIALIYRRRWDIEKAFDVFKNKFGQVKAWAKSETAKAMQAELLCITHNLIVLFEKHLETEHSVSNEAEEARRQQRQEKDERKIKDQGGEISSFERALKRATQTSLKLIRWLRSIFFSDLPMTVFLPQIRRLYQSL